MHFLTASCRPGHLAKASYVMRADTLAEVQAMLLPPGLERSERQPADPPEVVEIWFSPA